MKKQQKQLVILGAVLVLLIAAYFILPRVIKEPEEEQGESYAVTVLDSSLATKLSFTNEGTEYVFVKDGDSWCAEEDTALPIIQSTLENMVEKAGSITATAKIDDVTDFAQYGLEEPQHTVKLTVNGKEYVIHMGDYNDITGEYYLRMDKETTVYTVASATVTLFDTTLEALIEEEEETTVEETQTETTEAETETSQEEATETVETEETQTETTETEAAETVESETVQTE